MIDRVATKCSVCGIDTIVSKITVAGMKVPPARVLQAIAQGAALFKCARCATIGR